MGTLYSIFSLTILISVLTSAQNDEKQYLFKNSSYSSSFLSSLSQNSEEPIFDYNDFEKSSRILNVTNVTGPPDWVDTKATSNAQIFIFIATLAIYGVLLILSWKKDKKEAKEEHELRIKMKGTPIKLNVTKKYIENNKEWKSFSIVFEDKNKILEKEIFDLEETDRENNRENDENKESDTSYERKNEANDKNVKILEPESKENDKENIDENANNEQKSDENLNNQQNEEKKPDNKNKNEINENVDSNVSLSFMAPEEVYIYKKEEKKEENMTYNVFLAKKTVEAPKISWKDKAKKYHSLLFIFYHKNPRRTRLFAVTLYTFVLIGQIFFIGLFYLNSNPSTVKTVDNADPSTKKKPDSLSYEAQDFFIMIFCVFLMFILMTIIDLMSLETIIKENMSETNSNKIKEKNKKWRYIGLIICWGFMVLFIWVIIKLSDKYEKSVSIVWLVSTILSYVFKILIVSWFENNVLAWLASLPTRLREYFERKSQLEDHEIDDNNDAVREKRKYNDQVQEI